MSGERWNVTEHEGVQIRKRIAAGDLTSGVVGYEIRVERPIPAAKERCRSCGGDYVPHSDGTRRLHKCEKKGRQWKEIGAFGTPGEAVAKGAEKLYLMREVQAAKDL